MPSAAITFCAGLQAISLLDRPWEAACDYTADMEEYKRSRKGNPNLDPPPRQHGSAFAPLWGAGERRVRQVLLGHPDSATLAARPPEWLRYGTHAAAAIS